MKTGVCSGFPSLDKNLVTREKIVKIIQLFVPNSLHTVIDEMRNFAEKSEYSNIQSFSNSKYSENYNNDKDLFQTFENMLSVYRRLKTL